MIQAYISISHFENGMMEEIQCFGLSWWSINWGEKAQPVTELNWQGRWENILDGVIASWSAAGALASRFADLYHLQLLRGEIDAPRISSLCFANPGICPEPPKSSDQGPPSSPHSMSVNHSLSCPKYGQWSPRSRLHRKTFVQTRKT